MNNQFQVNRPIAMKKDGIQTRKRKPKSSVSSKDSSSKSSSKVSSSQSGPVKAVWELGNQYTTRNARSNLNDTYTARKFSSTKSIL